MKPPLKASPRAVAEADSDPTQAILRHWREAVPDDRLAHLIKDATRALLRALQVRLTPHRVPLGHWTFLRILWEKDGITQSELSEQAGVMDPTTSSALRAMERLGYVVRRKLPGNKKKVFVYLTPKGRLLKAKLVPFAEEVNRIAVRNVKAADVATMRRTLLAIIENLAADEVKEQTGHNNASRGDVAHARRASGSASLKRVPNANARH